MKTISSLVIVPLAMLSMISCGRRLKGEGNKQTQDRSTGSFSAVSVSAPVNAHIRIQEGTPTVTLRGYGNLLKHVTTRIVNNVLEISTDNNSLVFYTKDNVDADITLPAMTGLKVSGAGDADVSGDVNGEALDLDVSGAGDVIVKEIHLNELTVEISGAGDVKIDDGTARKISYEVSGAGDIKAFGLHGDEVEADVSGAGDIKLYAVKTLNARVSGVGSIHFRGKPAVTKESSGAGSIEDAN